MPRIRKKHYILVYWVKIINKYLLISNYNMYALGITTFKGIL